MGLLDKAKAAAEQAAGKAKEGIEEIQAKRDLSHAYNELGKTTFELAESGGLSHPQLAALIDKTRALRAQVEAGDVTSEPVEQGREEPGGHSYEKGPGPRYEDGTEQESGAHLTEDGKDVSASRPKTQDESDSR